MTVQDAHPIPVNPMNQKKCAAPLQLKVALKGDQRLVENVILEVRAIAQRYGLEIPSVSVVRQPSVGPKTKTLAPRRKPGTSGSRSFSI